MYNGFNGLERVNSVDTLNRVNQFTEVANSSIKLLLAALLCACTELRYTMYIVYEYDYDLECEMPVNLSDTVDVYVDNNGAMVLA